MKRKLSAFSRTYHIALRQHLERSRRGTLQTPRVLGQRAINLTLDTLDLARIHEQALNKLILPNISSATRAAMVGRAGAFFARAITPIEETHRIALENNVQMDRLNQSLRQRSTALE